MAKILPIRRKTPYNQSISNTSLQALNSVQQLSKTEIFLLHNFIPCSRDN